ncbi:aminodeoxychorismate/anthranilate synthase component II [bacterium]|nr:aminodeoxychorismate/anthranilate synthase component II [bacterium]
MICIIDNYDSFVYNLVQYIQELGHETDVHRNDRICVNDIAGRAYTGMVLSPGPGSPDSAGICIDLIRTMTGRVPILGVCLGHQAIAAAFGGCVVRADTLVHGKVSPVYHDGRTLFRSLPSPLNAGRYHSLTVQRETLPACLEVSAQLQDGTIMALRHREYPVEGLQFHPESILTPRGKQILHNFFQDEE